MRYTITKSKHFYSIYDEVEQIHLEWFGPLEHDAMKRIARMNAKPDATYCTQCTSEIQVTDRCTWHERIYCSYCFRMQFD